MFNLVMEYSRWYIVFCLIIGGGMSYVLYSKKFVWSKKLNIALAILRAVLISLLCFLLIGPLFKYVKNEFEKPTLVFLLDDSQSIILSSDSLTLVSTLNRLEDVMKDLIKTGYQIVISTLNAKQDIESISQLDFEGKETNISRRLKAIEVAYEHNNLAGVVFISDGIFNRGVSPAYYSYRYPIYTLGLGDTVAAKDIYVKVIYANKIAYLNNRFPLVAEIHHQGFMGQKIQVGLYHGSKLMESKKIVLRDNQHIESVKFLTSAEEVGVQRYRIAIAPVAGELTNQNNYKSVYIDILDSKEKILLVAAAPHPDIKALKYAIEKNKNYALSIHIPGMTDIKKSLQNERYDLVIMHQIPDRLGTKYSHLNRMLKENVPKWYILGTQSHIKHFNAANGILRLNTNSVSTDRVTPFFNKDLQIFTFDNEKREVIQQLPPVTVPFGNYYLLGQAKVVMYQQVGNVITEKPLLVIGEHNEQKVAVMTGEGLWQWRLQEYLLKGNHQSFDELINKLVQYLSAKKDKRKFKVYPSIHEYDESESVVLKTEVYNDIYEQISGQKIDLKVADEANNTQFFTYVNTTNNFRYPINGMPQGVYNFTASTKLNGKKVQSSGQFSVKALEIEALNTQADFNILRSIARESGGAFYPIADMKHLGSELSTRKAPDLIHSRESFSELIHLPWLMFAFILLISLEWLLRKVKGGY